MKRRAGRGSGDGKAVVQEEFCLFPGAQTCRNRLGWECGRVRPLVSDHRRRQKRAVEEARVGEDRQSSEGRPAALNGKSRESTTRQPSELLARREDECVWVRSNAREGPGRAQIYTLCSIGRRSPTGAGRRGGLEADWLEEGGGGVVAEIQRLRTEGRGNRNMGDEQKVWAPEYLLK